MKKILFFLIVFFAGNEMIAIAQVPNSGFENWTSGDPDDWWCSNVPAVGLVNIFQSGDSHSGSYAVLGEVVTYLTSIMAPVIQSGPGGTGFPVSEKYLSLELYYKFTPTGGDRFSVNVALMKNGVTAAQGAVALPAAVDSYTFLSVPLTYITTDIPDAAIIQISIIGPTSGSDFHLGSLMFVDDLAFSMTTGIERTSGVSRNAKCYPNPASEIINIPAGDNMSGACSLSVTDVSGKEIKKINMNSPGKGKDIIRFPVADLPAGTYFYTITSSMRTNNGKFSVVH